jgi:phosphoribosylaminoimidazole-succinocarboxamide synthase
MNACRLGNKFSRAQTAVARQGPRPIRSGDDLLLVATDRLSAFDVVLPTPIPDKGKVLTQLSLFWFETLRDIVPNHVLSATKFPAPASDFSN